jgi:hypothetical protein
LSDFALDSQGRQGSSLEGTESTVIGLRRSETKLSDWRKCERNSSERFNYSGTCSNSNQHTSRRKKERRRHSPPNLLEPMKVPWEVDTVGAEAEEEEEEFVPPPLTTPPPVEVALAAEETPLLIERDDEVTGRAEEVYPRLEKTLVAIAEAELPTAEGIELRGAA